MSCGGSCACAKCHDRAVQGAVNWGLTVAESQPGFSDFWRLNTAVQYYEDAVSDVLADHPVARRLRLQANFNSRLGYITDTRYDHTQHVMGGGTAPDAPSPDAPELPPGYEDTYWWKHDFEDANIRDWTSPGVVWALKWWLDHCKDPRYRDTIWCRPWWEPWRPPGVRPQDWKKPYDDPWHSLPPSEGGPPVPGGGAQEGPPQDDDTPAQSPSHPDVTDHGPAETPGRRCCPDRLTLRVAAFQRDNDANRGLVEKGGNVWRFDVRATFKEDDQGCDCNCCRVRQFVAISQRASWTGRPPFFPNPDFLRVHFIDTALLLGRGWSTDADPSSYLHAIRGVTDIYYLGDRVEGTNRYRVRSRREGIVYIEDVLFITRDGVVKPWQWKGMKEQPVERILHVTHPDRQRGKKREKCARAYSDQPRVSNCTQYIQLAANMEFIMRIEPYPSCEGDSLELTTGLRHLCSNPGPGEEGGSRDGTSDAVMYTSAIPHSVSTVGR